MLEFVRDISWQEFFEHWRGLEEESWRAHYTEKGFSSWIAWRKTYIDRYNFPARSFKLFKIAEAPAFVSKFWVGPYKGWRQYFQEGATRARFKDLISSPTIRDNPKVAGMLTNFPKDTIIAGLRFEGEVAIFEGTHRSAALALMHADHREPNTDVFIVLTDLDSSESELFDLARTQPE